MLGKYMKTARITLELQGQTLENLLNLAVRTGQHPDDLTVNLLYAALEAYRECLSIPVNVCLKDIPGIQ